MPTLRYTGRRTGCDPMPTRYGQLHPGDIVEVDDVTAEGWLTEHIQGHETNEETGEVEVITETDFEEAGVDSRSEEEPAEGKKRTKAATTAEATTPTNGEGEVQA